MLALRKTCLQSWEGSQSFWKPTCRRTVRRNFTINFRVLHLQCYYEETICTVLFCTDVFTRMTAWTFEMISCTDFRTDFWHYLVFCTDFCADVCIDLLHRFFARICTPMFARIFWGVPTTCWEAPKFDLEDPLKNSPCFGGLLGRGLGARTVVETLANLTKPESPRTGGLGGSSGGSSHSGGLENS